MRGDFEQALNNLIAASGGRVWLVSGDRDTETQARLWEEAVAKYGEEGARYWVAPPGHSNHERGIAADLGGDLELAAQLAPQFGLWRPMDWEPWHFEPVGSREDGSMNPYTNAPLGHKAPRDKVMAQTYDEVFNRLLGSRTRIFSPRDRLITQNRVSTSAFGLDPERARAPVFTTSSGGPPDIDKFMSIIRDLESSGNYIAVNPISGANGGYQFMDSTWGGYGGYSRAADAPPEVQDARARELMQQYYNKYGSWEDVALAWVAGENGNWQSGEAQSYAQQVKARL